MMRSLLTSLLLLVAPLGWAGDIARGEKLSATCQACHGKTGNGTEPRNPQYPKIAGQYRDYLIYALESYKNGTRGNLIMKGFADTLSKQDMADLAAYYAAQATELDDLSHLE